MSSSDVRVGAVMPTLNQAEWIEAAIESIAPQVDALVVVDDGCTDGTAEIVERMGVRIVRHETNQGTASAINTGIEALGEGFDWLTWVSSDNVMAPDWRESLLEAAAQDVGAVYGGFSYVSGASSSFMFTPHAPARLIGQEACYYGPAFIIRREAWQPHRGRISHDYDSWLRVEEACWSRGWRIVGVERDLCRYNAHDRRVTVTRRHEYDAPAWQAEARSRRGVAALEGGGGE